MGVIAPELAAILLAAAASAGLSGVIAWAGPVDPPEQGAAARTSHARPTPTSGGVAILAGSCLGGLAAAMAGGVPVPSGGPARLAAALALAGAMGLLGALDDLYDFGAKAKLAVQALAALAFAVFVARVQALPLAAAAVLPLGCVVGALGSALWIVVATNAVNFMDGADGVAAGALAVVLGGLALTCGGGLGALAWAGCAAGAAFLPWNMARRLFQGDAGALFSATLFAALSLVAAGPSGRGPADVWFGPLALLPFLTDVLLTLLRRARRGRPLLEAHRDHLYQLWLRRTGQRHAALAWRVWAAMAVSTAAAIALQRAPPALQPPLFAAAVVVCALAWTGLRRRLGD